MSKQAKSHPVDFLRQQAKIRAKALAEDFYATNNSYHRKRENLSDLVEFVLNCHGDEAYSMGKSEWTEGTQSSYDILKREGF